MAKDLRKFFGKPKVYNILGEEFSLVPLSGKDLDLLVDAQNRGLAGTKALMLRYLQAEDPSITMDDMERMSVEFLTEWFRAVMDVNGQKVDDVVVEKG